jgi:2-oxoglutarate ferredoxin oxidoreductase subunit beta
MTLTKPMVHHPALRKNALGLTHRDYEGSMSTLCAGCGHDSITAAIIQACFELDLPPHHVAKVSGIGCSSKTPTYFLHNAHGFNSVHGRMPSVATGAGIANRDLVLLGISGDGDTASIGLGQFCHAVRRRLNITYILMNNGCYGLTKGQFSATNDKSSPSKKGEVTPFEAIDMCQLAIQIGAGFVARSFSGDKRQLITLIKAAINYRGFALVDAISPCVTFNNHETSTKSYDYVRAHNMASETMLDFVESKDEITVDYPEGASIEIALHDGSRLRLAKLDSGHDPRDGDAALAAIRDSARSGVVATGLLYIDESQTDLHDLLHTLQAPLNLVPMSELCPGSRALGRINASFS